MTKGVNKVDGLFQWPPKSVRKQVSETCEDFPSSGCARQSLLKSSIKYQVFPRRVTNGPKISYSVGL